MRGTGTIDTSLVAAAQTGDRRALDELVSQCAAGLHHRAPSAQRRPGRRRRGAGHPAASHPAASGAAAPGELLSGWPGSPWIQVGTHLHRRAAAARRAAPLDEAAEAPDADAEFEDLTMLRLELSTQRRQVTLCEPLARRRRPGAAVTVVAGGGGRAEPGRTGGGPAGLRRARGRPAATHAPAARRQPRAGRGVAGPAAVRGARRDAGGLGRGPSPLWRKRLSRHTRDCATCGSAAHELIVAERLLVGFALLPVPIPGWPPRWWARPRRPQRRWPARPPSRAVSPVASRAGSPRAARPGSSVRSSRRSWPTRSPRRSPPVHWWPAPQSR